MTTLARETLRRDSAACGAAEPPGTASGEPAFGRRSRGSMFPFGLYLRDFIRVGRLDVIDADGNVHQFGAAAVDEEPITIALHNPSLYWTLALRPGLYVGEAYMAGELTIEQGTLYEFLDLCGRNLALRRPANAGALGRLVIALWSGLRFWNSLTRSRRNVAHHYDLAPALYEAFLDRDMQYSCAYFSAPGMTLDEAQAAKRRHIAAKLLLNRNQRVLDIGCGWGGLALEIAKTADVRVDGITLSHEQLKFAITRTQDAGAAQDVRFALKDYRTINQIYDRIVSVGMFEHVGLPHYGTYFGKIADLLAPDGIALVHSIGSVDGPGFGNAFIRKYIFPGGHIPALSEVLPAVERSGLVVTDVEILRLHYAETLRHWRMRFLTHWQSIQHLYDERFKRMWEFYLAGCEMSFRRGGLMVFQLQLAKSVDTVPMTRDYIHTFEESRRTSSSDNAHT